MTGRWAYRRWDGSQSHLVDEIEDLFARLADDLLYHGDPDAALRRLLTSGFDRADGERVLGLRELMERLRQARQQELERGELGGAFHEILQELDQVVAEERAGLDELAAEARASGDARRQEVTDQVVAERSVQLDLLPPDLAGKVRGLQHYEFTSSAAREHFEQLLERLRREIASSWFDQMAEALTDPDPAQLERTRQMFDALNRMLEQRERGEELDPSFEQFMERFGDFFPGNPQNLDELLEELAAQLAAVQAALDSMTPEQRAQLQALAESLFEDLDLRWQVDRLVENPCRVPAGDGATASAARILWGWPMRRQRRGAWGRWISLSSSCARPPRPARWPRSTWSRQRSTWETTAPARSTAWRVWPANWRTPASSNSAKAATS